LSFLLGLGLKKALCHVLRLRLDLLVPGSHGSTFGGAPFGAAVALKSLEILERENYAQRSADLGEYTLQALQNLEHPAIKTVRGKGLWIGIELDPQRVHARTLAERLMSNGLLCKETHDHVLRWIPPLIIQKQDLDRALEILQSTLKTF
jgi:ornithine--oxo-acid transaminase